MLNSFGLLMFATSLLTHMVTIDTIDHIFCSFGRLLSVENGQMGGRSCLSLIVVASTTTCSFHLAWANMQERAIHAHYYYFPLQTKQTFIKNGNAIAMLNPHQCFLGANLVFFLFFVWRRCTLYSGRIFLSFIICIQLLDDFVQLT